MLVKSFLVQINYKNKMKGNTQGDLTSGTLSGSSKKKSQDKPQSKVLNTDALDQSLWLVKVPQFVAERWASAENDDILGSLIVTAKAAGPNKPPTKQLNIRLNDANNGNGPDAFTLEELKSSNDSFFAFSTEKEANKGFSVDGKVTKNMVLKPQINEDYRQLIRYRGLSNVANRKEIGVANMQEIDRSSTQSHTVEFITSDRMELKRKAATEKALFGGGKAPRTSLSGLASSGSSGTEDGESVMTALRSQVFQAFETNERLTFKDILTCCADVPGFTKEKDLRDLLELYGKYNHRGMYKTFWELKPEYRDHSAALATSEA